MRSLLRLLPLGLTACFVDPPSPLGDTSTADASATSTSGSSTTATSTTSTSSPPTTTGAESSTTTGTTTAAVTTTTGTTGECPDADTDTHCDDTDNCPEDANLDQADGDRDGIGDLCDPCLHDGPTPPKYPVEIGPIKEITISDASLNGGGTFISVAPGATVTVAYHWKVNFCECPTCVTQGMVGILGHPPAQCFYNAGQNMNCMDIEGDEVQEFTAPKEPGIHPIRAVRTQEYMCTPDSPLINPSVEFAALCVN